MCERERPETEFIVSAADAATAIGMDYFTLLRRARQKKVEHVLRGDSVRPTYWFHPADVERMRLSYAVGIRQKVKS